MKRLTKTYSDGSYGVADDIPNENSMDFKQQLLDRLGSFEDPQEGKNHFTAWGDKIPESPKRNLIYDIKTLEDFVGRKDGTGITVEEYQALVNLQLEIYKYLGFIQSQQTNYYSPVYHNGEPAYCGGGGGKGYAHDQSNR